MNEKEKEKELLLKGIHLGIFLALADIEADFKSILDSIESLLSTAKQDKADEESLNSLRTQFEVYSKLLNNYTDYRCNSVTKYFSDLSISECNYVYDSIKELCINNTKEVHDEFNYVIKEVLLNNK